MLEVKDISILVDTRYLIQNLSFTLNEKDKLAIIGEEGNGKSTLLKSLLGICEYATVTGTVCKKGKIGYLEQSIQDEKYLKSVYDFLFSEENDYYYHVNNLYQYLEQLQLNDTILKQTIASLSGGEKIKIQILKLLIEEYDILFLDEPTNDLDLETLKWLEKFLKRSDKPIIYISHDETLLSNTANRILHIEQIKHKKECKHTLLNIDYQTYIKNRLNEIQKQTQLAGYEKREYQKKKEKLRRIMEKVEYQQDTITRSDPHGAKMLKRKMHTLKSQENKLNSKIRIEVPDVEENIHFFFPSVFLPKNKVILQLEMKELKVENRLLSKNIHLDIIGNEHICIIGKNGVGKTTLIKKIYEILCMRTDIKVGYMPQTYSDILDNHKNVLDFCLGLETDIAKIRMYLGNMKFTQDEMTGKIEKLSNGTKAKLLFLKFVLEKCNVLTLDEPTRNVSPLSNPVIRMMLKEFNGAIISISHDRKYIEEVADKVYELTEIGLSKISMI